MFLLESLLSAQKAYVENGKITQEQFDMLSNIDPSPSKDYTHWLCKQFANGEDINYLKNAIELYYMAVRKNLTTIKDIFRFKTLKDLEAHLETIALESTSRKEQEEQMREEGADLVWNSDDGLVKIYSIKTKQGSCLYGADTKWCITGKNSIFDSYYRMGVAFYFIINNNYKTRTPLNKIAVSVLDRDGVESMGQTQEYLERNLPEWDKVIEYYNDSVFEISNSLNEYVYKKEFNKYLQRWGIPKSLFTTRGFLNFTEDDKRQQREWAEQEGIDFNDIQLHPPTDTHTIEYYDKDLV